MKKLLFTLLLPVCAMAQTNFTNTTVPLNGYGGSSTSGGGGSNAAYAATAGTANFATTAGTATTASNLVSGTSVNGLTVSNLLATSGVITNVVLIGNGGYLTNLQNWNATYYSNGTSIQTITNALQSTPGLYQFAAGTFNLSNIVPANGVHIVGAGTDPVSGTTFNLGWGTNFIIDESTNSQNVWISGIRFTGGGFSNYVGTIQPQSVSYPYLYIPQYSGRVSSTYTNRNGLRMNGSGYNSTDHCLFDGFGAYGMVLVGTNLFTQIGAYSGFSVFANSFCTNFCGLGVWEWNYDWAQPGQTNYSVNLNTSAEFNQITDCHFSANGIGIYEGAGNMILNGNDVIGNAVGVMMNGNQNPGHPNFVNNSVLHNALYTLILTGDTQGQFMGNRFDGVIVHDGSHYDAFFDNITTCTFIATNTDTYQNPPGPLLIYNNLYSGNYGTNFIIQNNMPTAYTNQVQVWGNHSYSILNDNDLSAKSFVDLGNGIGLTNLYLSSNAYNNASIGTLLTNGGNGSGWIGIMASNMWCFKLSNNIVLSNKIF